MCAWCGRGALDGYRWGWSDGRLVHANCDDRDEAPGCFEEHGIAEGMLACDLGYHVVWPSEVVLAELEITWQPGKDGKDRDVQRVLPRRSGFQAGVIRFDRPVESPLEVPEGTRGIVLEVKTDGAPYLACRECAAINWPNAARLVPYRGRPRSRRTAATASADPAGARHARLRAALADGPATTDDLAAILGVTTRTVRRDLQALGAKASREARNVKWSLP